MRGIATLAASVVALSGCALGGGLNPRDLTYDAGTSHSDAGERVLDGGPVDGGSYSHDAGVDAGTDAGVDAGTGTVEVCNGIDDDLDALIDEGGVCPCPVLTFGARGYQFCDGATTWMTARARCEADGYSLTVIESAAEDAFVYAEMVARTFGNTWIGLNDRVAEGTWVWLDGAPLAYTHWDAGEPNDGGGGEDCAIIMTTSGREAEWDDRSCAGDRPYVCETP